MTGRGTPLRVLFAIPTLDRGGPDRVFFELLSGLDRRRFEPSLMVSARDGYYLSRLPSDVRVDVLGDSSRFRDRYPLRRSLQSIWSSSPDVVVATQRMTFTLGLMAAAFPRKTRLVLRQANDVSADFAALVNQSVMKHRLARQLALATLRRADAVICQSRWMRADLETLLGPRARLHVISNPIDVSRVQHEVRDAAVKLAGSPALISVGRLMSQKGYDVLLRAIPLVRPLHPDLHLTILGDGPDREALMALARELGITQCLTFAGYSEQPLASVKSADLFVLASRYEGFPNAALEALACGTPIVLTDCPGASSEIVLPGRNGRLARQVAAPELASAIDEAIRELPGYDRAAIIADTAARYGRQQIVAAYEELLARVVR